MYNIEQTFATKSPLYAQNSNAYGDRMERKLRQRKDKPTWPADMVTFISCLSNGTSLQAVTCPSKHQEGGHFGVLTGMWIFLHRTTNSRKPMVKIRFAFVLSCEESQNCHWTQCVSTTSISKKRYYFCSLTLISLNTFLFARVRGPCSYTQNMFIVARLTLRLLRWRISEPNDYVC